MGVFTVFRLKKGSLFGSLQTPDKLGLYAIVKENMIALQLLCFLKSKCDFYKELKS